MNWIYQLKENFDYVFDKNGYSLNRIHLQSVIDITLKSGKSQIKENVFAISAKGKIRLAKFNDLNKKTNS